MMLFFSRWILVTSLVGALAVNFLSPNFTLHVQIIVNMLFMVLLLFLFLFIYFLLYINNKYYNIIFCDYTYYYFYLKLTYNILSKFMILGGSYTSVFLILLGVSLTHVVLYRTVYYFHTFTYYNFMFKTVL